MHEDLTTIMRLVGRFWSEKMEYFEKVRPNGQDLIISQLFILMEILGFSEGR